MIVKVNWSGGKDSTASVIMHLRQKDYVKVVCYIPMLTRSIPLILREHLSFIENTANTFRELGAEVYFVHGITYEEFVLKRSSRGKYKGRLFGFPCFITGRCGFARDSKIKALKNVNVGFYHYEDIGIAYDEVNRQGQLTSNKRSILCELHITENNAFELCQVYNCLSPVYKNKKRDGCALCPHGSIEERIRYFNDFPEAVEVVKRLQDIVKQERPEQTPLRGHNWFL